ncbi:hypothetical protein B0H12DRAFT_209576 [Mycena haematopus]|nr:hypothetical protein B0H12DRAFT_209576 [Mycena haematopus]
MKTTTANSHPPCSPKYPQHHCHRRPRAMRKASQRHLERSLDGSCFHLAAGLCRALDLLTIFSFILPFARESPCDNPYPYVSFTCRLLKSTMSVRQRSPLRGEFGKFLANSYLFELRSGRHNCGTIFGGSQRIYCLSLKFHNISVHL